ncbi:protein of unknown function [Nitrospira defluvii]|uniref:Uncharacterized protein n=1 Tax=Nitrospira defluvii TaxID=330214 RepID=D8PH56_9BACT|nr:protein of unknown function [Nitrospira defluvii]
MLTFSIRIVGRLLAYWGALREWYQQIPSRVVSLTCISAGAGSSTGWFSASREAYLLASIECALFFDHKQRI